ncbi:MAG: transcription elongation factor GreA [Clostridia bacterium]|nr:transcription elongation factor GreA [Clostridia bacterium]
MADMKQNIMTAEGLKELQEQYDYLTSVRRNEVAKQIEVARGFGDLSENAEYDEAKKEQGKLEEEISRLQALLRSAVVEEVSTDKVSVGTTVKFTSDMLGECEYAIVGTEQTDPENGRISYESAIGAALVGRKKGETVEVEIPAGTMKMTILSIKPTQKKAD